MNKITYWIRWHQVLAFFLLVYAVAWPAMFLTYFIFPGNNGVMILCMPFMLFSPALSAILIAGIAQPRPKNARGWPRWIVFILAWLVSAFIMILHPGTIWGSNQSWSPSYSAS